MKVKQVGLFEGYGGLSMAVSEVLGAELAYYSEIDPAASRLLAHHHPDVPNLGDVTQIDWAEVRDALAEHLLVLTGGFPCQDVSLAGRRAGIRPGTRSGLWTHFAYAIDQLRPGLVVIENVRGLLSADAACDLEPCPWCLGDDEGRPLRALGAVLGDLAELGYDARWCGLRAADVGAPHGRFRVFVTAWPTAHAGGVGRLPRARDAVGWDEAVGGKARENADDRDRTPADPDCAALRQQPVAERRGSNAAVVGQHGVVGVATPDPAGVGRREGRTEPARFVGGPHAAVGGPRPPADPNSVGPFRAGTTRGRRGRPADHGFAAPDAASDGQQQEHSRDDSVDEQRPANRRRAVESTWAGGDRAARDGRATGAHAAGRGAASDDPTASALAWGDYEPAIRRWELILGRPAPAPTQTGRGGGQQLSPRFVEWLMGLPEGHVTAVPGLTRNEQLGRLGNGVVPQQAAAALRHLLEVESWTRAA